MLYCDGIYVYEGVPDDDVKYNKWSDRWPVNSDYSVFMYLFCHTYTSLHGLFNSQVILLTIRRHQKCDPLGHSGSQEIAESVAAFAMKLMCPSCDTSRAIIRMPCGVNYLTI